MFAMALGLVGCGGGGRLDLVLDLPDDGDLRPAGMTTVTVVAQPFSGDPVETTSVIAGDQTFQAGDLPAGEPVAIQVELRDATGRLVGYGRALAPVELSVDEITEVRIAVRRPFVYAASSAGLFTFDPTRDSIDPMYQGRLSPPAPLRTVPLGGDQLAVIRPTEVDLIATEDHQVAADPIGLAAAANDAAPVPGERKVVLGVATGFTIVDLETGEVRPIDTGGIAITRVTVGVADDGRIMAYGLVNPVAVPEVDEVCATTSSRIAMIDLAAPDQVTFRDVTMGLADLAAGVDVAGLFGAAPCTDEIVQFEEGDGAEVHLADLPRAASVAIQGTRVWGAGTQASKIRYTGGEIDFVEDDAIEILTSIDLRGGGATQFAMNRRRETMIDTDDPAREHAQVMKPLSALPLDLVVLAGGEFIGVATRYKYHSSALTDGIVVVLPEMDGTVSDLILIDGATLTAAQRVRTDCDLVTGNADIFPNWECATTDEAETPRLGTFEPTALGALFGAR
jgi:hypothetical protein